MSFDRDEELLQDFLVEAGEILESLSEELVALEGNGEDSDLLNGIFRGFHTIKGGAGFLQINTLVDVCHIAENVFDELRNGRLSVSPELMDVVLQALDDVNRQFEEINDGGEPAQSDVQLIKDLAALIEVDDSTAQVSEDDLFIEDDTHLGVGAMGGEGEIDQSQAALSNSSTQSGSVSQTVPSAGPAGQTPESVHAPITSGNRDEISEDEFDQLLDELHGVGKGPTINPPLSTEDQAAVNQPSSAAPSQNVGVSSKASADQISEDEFEQLLDELHGEGQGPNRKSFSTNQAAPKASTTQAQAVPQKESIPGPVAKAQVKASASTEATPKDAKSSASADNTPEATVRVGTKRLDGIMNLVGELVLVRNRLVRLGVASADEEISKAVSNLDVVTSDLQMSVMKTRMQPIKKVFGRFPRVVRDLARSLKKEIKLELVGEDTDLDKNLVEALADPLVHLVRNSVDHGIEMPEVRASLNKDPEGKVVLTACQEGDHIVLTIKDDGKGMNASVLREKAVEKGLMDAEAADRLTDREAFFLIFHAGFSTAEKVSDVSGRGVGMDVVKTKITQLNGSIDIDSKAGKGTVISIKVPLTLAIMPTLMVKLADQTFAFPLVNVNEIFNIDLAKTNVVDGQEVVMVRKKALPLFHLKEWLVGSREKVTDAEDLAQVVVVSIGDQKIGFVVDQLIGQEEVVIKPLGKILLGTAGMAGATITGDGRIALILDLPNLIRYYAAAA